MGAVVGPAASETCEAGREPEAAACLQRDDRHPGRMRGNRDQVQVRGSWPTLDGCGGFVAEGERIPWFFSVGEIILFER